MNELTFLDRIVRKTLSSVQRERLEQIRRQQLFRDGKAFALLDNEFSTRLKLSDDQRRNLMRLAVNAAQQLDEEVADVQIQSINAVLRRNIDDHQFAKFHRLIGKVVPTRKRYLTPREMLLGREASE